MEKSCRKLAPKASPRPPLLILLYKRKQPLHARNSFKNKMFWKRIIKKALKMLTLFFLLSPVPFNRQSYHKQ